MIDKNNIPVGYKDSPVGIIPQEWEVKTFGEIGIFSKGSGISRSEANTGNIPCVRYGELYTHHHNFIKIYNSFISKEVAANSKLLKYGDILFAATGETKGEIGKSVVFIDKIEAYAGGDIIIVSPDFKLSDSLYMGYLSNSISVIRQKATRGQGDAIVHITSDAIKNILIPLPPLAEQKKIAEILCTWDDAIEKQSKLIEKLELRKRGLMQRLLTGRTRLPGFTESWKQVKLGEIFSERNEIRCENLPLLSITSDRGVILQSESEKKDISNDDKSKYKRICPNDIGYNTMRMWQGRSALSKIEGIVSPAYTIVTLKENNDVFFLSELIKVPRVVYNFWAHSQGLVNDTLNCKYHDFSQVKVEVPSYVEQQAIAEVLTSAEREIKNHRKKIEALRQQKRGLMQQLLTGKTRVKI